jgi:polyphosphate kinase 2 (PPK2 family)
MTVHNLLLENGFVFYKDGSIGLTERSQYTNTKVKPEWNYPASCTLVTVEEFLRKHPKFEQKFILNKTLQ